MPPTIPPPASSGVTRSTDVPLYWCTYGTRGAPRLLVLHGGPGAHHDYLLPQLLTLADSHELVFYDQRGGGRSKTDDRATVTWRTHVEDLGRVIVELGLERPDIVGYSWGGLLALLHALEQTHADPAAAAQLAPRSLLLIDPAPLSRAYRVQFEREFAERQQGYAIQALRAQLAASGLRERDPVAYRQRTFELSVAGYFYDPEKARDLTPFRVTGRIQQSVWESLGDFDLVPQLPALAPIPTFIAHGREDPIPLASSEAAASAMDAELLVLEHCGHVPYVEQPAPLFAGARHFLARHAPPR